MREVKPIRRLESWTPGIGPALLGVVAGLLIQGAPLLAEGGKAESDTTPDPWTVLTSLVGSWEGEIDGRLGTGRGVRRYELVAGGHFLMMRHRSVRLPQEKSPVGDEHEEVSVFSFDRERKTIVYREFLSEGVVVRSPCTVEGESPATVVCIAEAVESGPGIRARLTLEITDRYRFTEVYYLAFPGEELQHYFTNRWTRSPVPVDWD